MASSTQVIAAAADAAGGHSAGAGHVSFSAGALIAVCTSVATFALQFIVRTLALGRWQGQIESRVAAGEVRADERHRDSESRSADRQAELDRRMADVDRRINEVKGDLKAAIDGLCERQEETRRELLNELRMLRERTCRACRGGED